MEKAVNWVRNDQLDFDPQVSQASAGELRRLGASPPTGGEPVPDRERARPALACQVASSSVRYRAGLDPDTARAGAVRPWRACADTV